MCVNDVCVNDMYVLLLLSYVNYFLINFCYDLSCRERDAGCKFWKTLFCMEECSVKVL